MPAPRPLRPARRNRRRHLPLAGFTLIELLTVIAIIGILAAILLPVVGRVRESARSARCVSNLRQTGVAVQAYAQENKGRLPSTGFFGISPYYNRDARNFQHSLLPYMGLKRAISWSTAPENGVYSGIFDCPSYKGPFNGKAYLAQRDLTMPDGSSVMPWGLVKDSNGTDINPKPRRLSDMPPRSWAIRDNDATVDGTPLTAHPNARNTLFFEGNVQRVATTP